MSKNRTSSVRDIKIMSYETILSHFHKLFFSCILHWTTCILLWRSDFVHHVNGKTETVGLLVTHRFDLLLITKSPTRRFSAQDPECFKALGFYSWQGRFRLEYLLSGFRFWIHWSYAIHFCLINLQVSCQLLNDPSLCCLFVQLFNFVNFSHSLTFYRIFRFVNFSMFLNEYKCMVAQFL